MGDRRLPSVGRGIADRRARAALAPIDLLIVRGAAACRAAVSARGSARTSVRGHRRAPRRQPGADPRRKRVFARDEFNAAACGQRAFEQSRRREDDPGACGNSHCAEPAARAGACAPRAAAAVSIDAIVRNRTAVEARCDAARGQPGIAADGDSAAARGQAAGIPGSAARHVPVVKRSRFTTVADHDFGRVAAVGTVHVAEH